MCRQQINERTEDEMPCSTTRSRIACIAALTVIVLVVVTGQALADSASISVTNTAGQSDPAAEMPRVVTVSGDTAAPERVFIKYRNPGGAPCASTADTGSWFENYGDEDDWYETPEVNGSFSFSHAGTWGEAGTDVFCIWLAKTGETIVSAPITQTITFRSPTGTITATVNPLMPQPGQPATVTVTGASEAAENVYAKVRPAGGAPCAATYEADPGESLIEGANVNGSFGVQATTRQSTAGTYLICLWLTSSPTNTSPVAGPQPETFTVGSPAPPPPPPLPPPPPPPCVVPRFNSHMRLVTVEQRIRADHCGVGRVRYTRTRRFRRGAVIKLTPGPTARLGYGAHVGILVSSGRPRGGGR